jgi:hypothetical protein
MRGHHAAYENQSTGARAGAGNATQLATRKLSTIGHIGVSEFAAYLCTKRIHPADSLGFGTDILFDGEVRRPFAFPYTAGFGFGDACPGRQHRCTAAIRCTASAGGALKSI